MPRIEVNRSGEMEAFVQVVESGGFSAAARLLGMTPSAVSKLISRMELRLGIQLVHRSTRKLQLTPEGTEFYERSLRVLADMDEAERCHEIAYISYGRLIARGIAADVITASGLITFRGEGAGADKLAHALAARPGVETAVAFGAAIHVSGTDRAALEDAVSPWRREPFRWTEVAPTLEDVFIQLMGRSQDNEFKQLTRD
eukprot:gene51731-69234_t